jgi:trans-aconitate methyltransferase
MTEWHADDYSRQSSLQQAMAEQQLAKLTLQGTEHILDVGCGDGKITAAIAARVPSGSVLGVDPSRDMIAFAASHFAPPAHANLRFEVADARALPYRNQFDLIVSFNALHWVPEQAAALSSIGAALKPSGQAILRFVSEGPRECLEDVIEEARHDARWAGYFAGFRKPYAHFTADEYRTLAQESGLRVLHLDIEDGSWDFKTRDAFAGFARATFVEWTQHLPAAQRDTFITQVLDRYESIAGATPSEEHTFKFYQMQVQLTPM